MSYDILCHQESLWAPFPTEYLNMEYTSDRSPGEKSANEVATHDSATEDTSTRHSCADSVNGAVDEDSTRNDASHMDGVLPSCVPENSPDNDDTVVSPGAVDAEKNDEENKVENHQEGTTSAVSTKDAEGSSVSTSAEEVHEEVLNKDKLIVSLEEEV